MIYIHRNESICLKCIQLRTFYQNAMKDARSAQRDNGRRQMFQRQAASWESQYKAHLRYRHGVES